MEPFYDPIWDQMDALENSTEHSMDPGPGFNPILDQFMDPLGFKLGALEASMENIVVSPPQIFEPEPPTFSPPPPTPKISPPVSETPPLPPDPIQRYWTEMEPPAAARPYYSPTGLSRHPYRSRARAGAGTRYESSRSALSNWCAEANQHVEEDICRECEQWGDHGSGHEQCYYLFLEEQENKDNDSIEKDNEE